MASFYVAVSTLLDHEGGIANIGDGEGVTAFGWTEATAKAFGVEMPKTAAEASTLYEEHFWLPIYEQIASQSVATKVFDDAVNQGHPTAHKMLQKALCAIGSIVEVDGAFGPATLAATNMTPEALLLPWMRHYQYASYCRWVDAKPEQREKFRLGLARRAAWPDQNDEIAEQLLSGKYSYDMGVQRGTIAKS
jgi:lysozyme family protein